VLPLQKQNKTKSIYSSFSERNGEVVDAVLLLLSCCLKSVLKMNKPTKHLVILSQNGKTEIFRVE